jgi:RND superfamily putative drug exporter
MLLLPAVLHLLGPITWRLPRWLERRLPRLSIEAEPTTPARRHAAPLEPALDVNP